MTIYVRGDFHCCPCPLSADPYTMCEYSCHYCFIVEMYEGMLKKKAEKGLLPNDPKIWKNKLHNAFDKRSESKDPTILALRSGLPVLVGRKCEPFCPTEKEAHATINLLRLLNEYGVKKVVEAKGTSVSPNDLIDLADGILVSIIPGGEKLHDTLEPGTPSFDERFKFAKALKGIGLWVGLTAEPILPTVNDSEKIIKEYAEKASEIGVDHVNFGEYRWHNVKVANRRMKEAGLDLVKILGSGDRWPEIGQRIFTILRDYGLKVSTPDWINFGLMNDCESCCGLDDFGVQHFTHQASLQIIAERGRVTWSDIVKFNNLGNECEEKFKKIWNGDGRHYNLSDAKGVHKVDYDGSGNVIYGVSKKLAEVFT